MLKTAQIPIPKGKMREEEEAFTMPTPKKGLPPGAVPVSSQHAPGSSQISSSHEVAQMQQSIIDLSKEISQNDIFSKTPKSNANDMLGNFFTNNYLQTALDKLGQKGVIDVKNFATYLGNIDGNKLSAKPDGKWGPKTQSSLKQIVAFAEAFLTLAQELGVNIGYSTKNLAAMKELLPKDDKLGRPVFAENANDIAKEIGEQLQLINAAYKTFEKEVLNNTEYSQALGAKTPLVQSQTKSIDQVSLGFAARNIHQQIITPQNAKAPLTFNDILNINNFRQYLQANTDINVADSKAVNDALNSIEQQIAIHNNPNQDGF